MDGGGLYVSSRFINKPLVRVSECVFFLSSGADVLPERDEFDGLVAEVNNQYAGPQFVCGQLRLRVDRWEHDAPRRFDGRPNQIFIDRAVAAHCTVVLLSTVVRPGTREEIEGVLADARTQLAVIRMVPDDKAELDDSQLQQFLKDHQADFLYRETGPPGSRSATRAMVGVLTAVLAEVTRVDGGKELFIEDR